MFCMSHRVMLVLEVEGVPTRWDQLKIPNPSGSCPFCRAMREGAAALEAAIYKWKVAARMDPKILTDSAKVSENNSDKEIGMDPKKQQHNKEKLREENNRKIVAEMKRGSIPNNNKRQVPTKKPNHLRLV